MLIFGPLKSGKSTLMNAVAADFPAAIRRVDVRVPDSELPATGAVLVDTPGLYTRMRFGYDRMTRDFRNAAACAIFAVKSDTLFLEQVFAEFQQLLDLFSRIFLVVNVDSQKRDVSPDGTLGQRVALACSAPFPPLARPADTPLPRPDLPESRHRRHHHSAMPSAWQWGNGGTACRVSVAWHILRRNAQPLHSARSPRRPTPRMRSALLPLVSTLLLAAVAPTQELLAVNFQGQAFGVDVATGQSRSIGSTGANFCNAMASHGGVLYATASTSTTTPSRLVTIDPITAQATVLFANLGVDVRALCSNEGTQQLFAIANGNPDTLRRIDVTTGVVTTIGSTGMTGIQALDAGGGFGPLFGWDVNLGLVQIDRTTGVASDVDPNLGAQGAIVQFLSLYRDGSNIHMLGGNTSLYEINRFTGVVTQIGTNTTLPDLRGAEHRLGKGVQFGTGCQTAVAPASSLTAKSEFLAGSLVPLISFQHAPNSLGILIVGLSNTVSAGTPLPISLDPIFGTNGCQLLVSADLLLAAQANGTGKFTVPFTMPAQLGLAVFFQLAALEPVPGGLSFTSGFGVQTPF